MDFHWIPLDKQLGLLQVLPWNYWIGFGACLVSLVIGIRVDSNRTFLLKAFILFLLIWGIPVLFEKNAPVWDGYRHLKGALEIVFTGSLPTYDINLYSVNWPGFFIFTGVLKEVPNINPWIFIKFYPILASGLTIAAISLFLKKYLSRTTGRIALLILSFLCVWFQFHVSPQSIGLVLGILTLFCLEQRSRPWRILAIILFTSLLISHATIMFIVLATALVAFLLEKSKSRLKSNQSPNQETRYSALLFAVLTTSWLLWNALGTSEVLMKRLVSQIAQIFLFDERVGSILAVRTTENIYPIPPIVRIGALGVFILISMIYLAYVATRQFYKGSKNEDNRRRPNLTIPISLVLVAFILTAADVLTFGGQFYDRNILIVAVISPIFAVLFAYTFGKNVKASKQAKGERKYLTKSRTCVVVITCLCVVAFANFTTVFYQENLYIVPDASFAARDFLENSASNGTTIEGGMFPSDFEKLEKEGEDAQYPTTSHIIVLDVHTEIWMRQWLGKNAYDAMRNETTTMNKTYVNGEYEMFWRSEVT